MFTVGDLSTVVHALEEFDDLGLLIICLVSSNRPMLIAYDISSGLITLVKRFYNQVDCMCTRIARGRTGEDEFAIAIVKDTSLSVSGTKPAIITFKTDLTATAEFRLTSYWEKVKALKYDALTEKYITAIRSEEPVYGFSTTQPGIIIGKFVRDTLALDSAIQVSADFGVLNEV